MDAIVITGNDHNGIQMLKHLFSHFQTKDLGKLKYFLGIEIAQYKSGGVMNQRKYALEILEESGMLDCKLTLQLGEIRQGEDSVTKYFNSLKRIWQDLNLLNDYEWKSPQDCSYYKKMVDVRRFFKFLAGLNVEFDELPGRIIRRNSLPPISEVFAEVRREESRR